MAIITAITPQKNSSRVNLFLDGEFYCGLCVTTVATARLKVGKELDKQALTELIYNSELSSAFEKALKYLGYKSTSSLKMQQYLIGKGYDSEIAKITTKRLEEYKYIDDKAFAADYVKSSRGKYGNGLLSYKLKNLGISSNIISQVLPEDEAPAAYMLAQKYLKTKKPNREKLYAHLYNKGFSSDSISATISKLQADNLLED